MTNNHKLYNQYLYAINQNPVIAYGSAGTGKTCMAVKRAISWLKDSSNQVVITRPNVSFADESGFLPGTAREKMAPWIVPIQQNFEFNKVKREQQDTWESDGKLIYLPLEFAQGITLDNTLFIVDECQNTTFEQLKVILTRTGKNSKIILCGDARQVSPKFKGSGLAELIIMIEHLSLSVDVIEFGYDDVLRGETCKMFIKAFEDWELCNES